MSNCSKCHTEIKNPSEEITLTIDNHTGGIVDIDGNIVYDYTAVCTDCKEKIQEFITK